MHVEMYFDFSCPYAYMASTRIEALCATAGATLVWRPMLLGGVFRGVGHTDEPRRQMGPAKARHNQLDIERWAERWGLPLRMPARHPMRTVRALRALL
ncbi:MAG TPA: DsbA family protein, partial [Haliangium sp.]|nr:DsbA family protein [Haliangium sp.]